MEIFIGGFKEGIDYTVGQRNEQIADQNDAQPVAVIHDEFPG